jgi:hypothetical protein
MPFVKLDCGMLRSTIWFDRDAREVLITALLMAEPLELTVERPQLEVMSLSETGWRVPVGWYGFVGAAGVGIVHAAGVEQARGMAALERMGKPEPDSRSKEFDGRRMIRIDGGYVILNFMRYRDRDYTSAERSRRYRQRKASNYRAASEFTPVTVSRRDGDTVSASPSRDITQAEVEVECRRKKSEGDPTSIQRDLNPAGARSNGHATNGTLPPQGREPEPRKPVHIAAVTPAFLALFAAYPNQNKKQQAAQEFQDLAGSFGGEEKFAARLLALFKRGFLKRHPYDGEARFVPTLATVLAERRFEETWIPAVKSTGIPGKIPDLGPRVPIRSTAKPTGGGTNR